MMMMMTTMMKVTINKVLIIKLTVTFMAQWNFNWITYFASKCWNWVLHWGGQWFMFAFLSHFTGGRNKNTGLGLGVSDTSDLRQYSKWQIYPLDTLALVQLSRHFSTSAEVSAGHFGTWVKMLQPMLNFLHDRHLSLISQNSSLQMDKVCQRQAKKQFIHHVHYGYFGTSPKMSGRISTSFFGQTAWCQSVLGPSCLVTS